MCLRNKTCYFFTALIALVVLGLGGYWYAENIANSQTLEQKISHIDQDPAHYIAEGQLAINISPAEQAQLAQTFLNLYFLPWSDDVVNSTLLVNKALAGTQHDIDYFLQNPGWQLTYQPFAVNTIRNLVDNSNLAGFPKINRPGIIVHVTQVRIFPTLLPSFNDPQQAGEGYPFDNWIATYLFPGTPVRILQQSKDQLWYLVQTSSLNGWILGADVGFVSPDFITAWKKHTFVVPLQDGAPLYNSSNQVLSELRKGVLYPYVGEQSQQMQVLMPYLSTDGNVQIQTLLANKTDIRTFPIPANAQNVAMMARNFMGGQYGWGDLYALRDCSATTSDILANFGIWLPRNSTLQARMGKIISLSGLSREEKIKTITQQAIPFFTLIHFPGHIGIYIGSRNDNIYVLQDVWGLRTNDLLGREGRAVMGKTVILPLEFANTFSNVNGTQLDRADSFSVLTPASYQDEKQIIQSIWQ